MITLTIDESKWRCGLSGKYKCGLGSTKLLNPEGFLCCLGQIEEQLGIPRDALLNKDTPAELRRKTLLTWISYVEDYEHYLYEDNRLSNDAIDINDDEQIDHETRKYNLAMLFALNGIELIFVGEPVLNLQEQQV